MINDLFSLILKSSASASIAILLIFILTPFLNKRYFMKWKYQIWLILSVYLCLPVDYAEIYRQINRWHNVKPVSIPALTNVTNTIMVTLTQPELAVPETTEASEVIYSLPSPLTIFSWIWLDGVIILLLVSMINYILYKRKINRNAIPLTREDYLKALKILLKDMNIQKNIKSVIWSGTSSPMMIGFLKPILVLPNEDYFTEEIHFILKHELLHYKRYDIYGKSLLLLTKTIHWFNPIVSLMYKEAVVDMELSCDEEVVWNETSDIRKAYAETLFTSLTRQNKTETYFSTQFQGGTKIMKKRFQNILSKAPKRNGRILLAVILLLVLTLGTLTGCLDTQKNETDTQTNSTDRQNITSTTNEAQKDNGDNTENDNTENTDTTTVTFDEEDLSYFAEASEEQAPLLTTGIITLNKFLIAYFTQDTDALKTYLTEDYSDSIDTYDGTLNLTLDKVDCHIAGETEEIPKMSFIGDYSAYIKTEQKHLIIKGADIPIPDYELEDGYTLVYSVPFQEEEQDYKQYLTVEMVKQGDGWKIQFYGLEL